jgi:hypothetical protein
VRGEAQPGDLDWYAVAVDSESHKDLSIIFRRRGGICPFLTILDGLENVVYNTQACDISARADVPIRSGRYFVQIDPRDFPLSYELAVSYKQ